MNTPCDQLPGASGTIWLAACFPALGFEVGQSAAPSATDGPAVLAEDGRVLQANAAARQAGIKAGITLAAAHSLAAELACWQRDAAAERQRLGQLGLAGYRYSSRVSLAWPTADRRFKRRARAAPAPMLPAAVLLEARGSLRLFGQGQADAAALAALLGKVAARFRGLGHRPQLAAAATPLAALALARTGLEGLPGNAEAALRQVPLACLDLSAQQLERLANMGLRRLGQVLALPAAELGSRFQPSLVDYLHRLTGRKADPRPHIEPPERFRASAQLLQAAVDSGTLLLPMRRLAEQLARWLAARRLGTSLLIWELRPLAGPGATLAVRFAAPTADAAAFLDLSRLRLESAPALGEVASVALRTGPATAMPLPPAAGLWERLPGETAPATPGAVALVDLLAARLGREAIHTLALQADHRPEHAWAHRPPRTLQSATHPTGAAHPTDAAPSKGAALPSSAGEFAMQTQRLSALACSRPLWLLPTPLPVAERQAAAFEFLAGPERIETGWWDAADLRQRRDYFVVATPGQAHWWIFRDCRPRHGDEAHRTLWHLHGYFA